MKNKNAPFATLLFLAAFFWVMPFAGARQHSLRHKPLTKEQQKAQHKKIVAQLLKRSVAANKRSTERTMTTLTERLVGQCDFANYPDSTSTGVWGQIDTFIFNYTDCRGSYFDLDEMGFSNSFVTLGLVPYVSGTSDAYLNSAFLPDQFSDTSLMWQYSYTALVYGLNEWKYSTYDTNNNILSYTDSTCADSANATGTLSKCINTYDANNHISASWYFTQDTTSWDSTEYRFFSFNTSGLLTEDSTYSNETGAWSLEERYIYTYNASGNVVEMDFDTYDPIAGTWDISEKYILTYYNPSEVQTIYDSTWDTTLQISAIDSFGWTPGVNYVTYQKEYDYTWGALDDYSIFTKHVSAAGLPDTTYTTTFYEPGNVADGNELSWYIYDSYSQPVITQTYTYDSATGQYDNLNGITHYYYQIYEECPSAVANIPTPNEVFTVFPNPATNQINITRKGFTSGAFTNIRIINTLGQTARSENLLWMQETEQLSFTELSPGNYWLIIQDENGNTLCRQEIVIDHK